MIIKINDIFILIGKPHPMFTSRRRPQVFFCLDMPGHMPFWEKYVLVKTDNILSTFDHICQYLSMYGTAHLPTVRYCVPIGIQ